MCRKTLIEEMQEVTDKKWSKLQKVTDEKYKMEQKKYETEQKKILAEREALRPLTTEMAEKEAHIDFISTEASELFGKDVIVYCRYLFAVPVRGYITDVSEYDGAYKISFYNFNPGGLNVTMHNGKFFLPEQCKVQCKIHGEEDLKAKNTDALNQQIGGDHYKNFAIQPVEFITKNKLSFLQGDIIKRMCRYNVPGGKGLQDLQKIKHEVDLLIQLEEWE